MTASLLRFPCPCCGHLVFEEPPGSDDICLICFWEDDITQLRWPQLGSGANMASLLEAQQSYMACGASEERFRNDVRRPNADELLDPRWRPIRADDRFETADESAPWPADPTHLYYWLPTFWRAPDA